MQFQNLHLAVRPAPIAGELTAGYLVRVAAANGYDGPRALVRALRQGEGDFKENFASSLMLSSTDLLTLFGPYPGYCGVSNNYLAGLHSDDFNHSSLRWCPFCLSDAIYLRGEWGLKLNCACPIHGIELCEKCLQCGTQQRLERTNLSSCFCGSKLNTAQALPASQAMLRLHCMLFAAMPHRQAQEHSPVNIPTWLRLVQYLGAFNEAPLVSNPGQISKLHQLPVAKTLTTGAAILLSDWPNNFDHLLKRIRAELPDATHIGEAFGPLYRVLYRHLDHPTLRFLQDAFEAYLHENWFGLLGKRNRRLRLETIASHPHQPVALVAQVAGVKKSVVRHLAETGSIEAKAMRARSGRTTWAIPLYSAQNAREYTSDQTTMGMAAKRLGLPKHRVRELVDVGLIRAVERNSPCPWMLSNTDIDNLHSFLRSVQSIKNPGDQHVTLAIVLKSWRLHGREFSSLIKGLLTGEIAAHNQAAQSVAFVTLHLNVKELRAWLDKYRSSNDAWLSVSGAANALGIKQQVAYELVSQGLLKAITTIKNGTACRHVYLTAIEEFRATYISLAELAHSQRKAPRAVLSMMETAPVCGPNIDRCRQYFYRRRDVAHLLAVRTVEA